MFDPSSTKETFLKFGSGGGFTGKVINFYITEQGKVYNEKGSDLLKITSLSKNTAKQLFTNHTKLGLDKMTLNDPGNKYFFIEKSIKGSTQTIKWGKNQLDNKNVETFYNLLMNIVKDKSLNTNK
ncbi:MAG: hypothetical protein IPO92_01805 [Saprospiraceae bacterium]|nr:hypothetical protein [Saprospiraceae bacterium]